MLKAASQSIRRFAVPVAIIVLPLVGFAVDRAIEEKISMLFGPSLYALYVLGLAAYAAISFAPTLLISIVGAGVLGVGAAVSALLGVLGLIALILNFVLVFITPILFLVMLPYALAAASPGVTSWALWKVSLSTFRNCAKGRALSIVAAGVGAVLAIAVMVSTIIFDARWTAVRYQVFEADDVRGWEQALTDIKSNPLCGNRRCLMPICDQLIRRFGKAAGECGPFACPFGLALDAPNVPANLAAPFQTVYGYSVKQVCAIGD